MKNSQNSTLNSQLIPPGYKRTEGGVIPEDWYDSTLGDAVSFLDGRRRPIRNSDREKMQGTIPYYGASGIVDYVNDYLFDDDLILLGEDGENILSRNCRLAFRISGKVWVNNHAHVLKPNPDVSIGFLVDFLESLNYEQYNSGTAQPKLNKRTCVGIPIALPPTNAEQEAIAEALSDTDALIESLEQLLVKKRQIKQGAMQELLTGKKRLPGFECTPGYKQTKVGAMPKDWVLRALGTIGTWSSGGTPRMSDEAYWSGDIPWVSPKDMKVSHLHGSIDHISPKAVADGARLLPAGAILVVVRGMILAHSLPVARAERPLAFNQDIKAVVTGSTVDSHFLLYWLSASARKLLGLTTESTHGTKRLPPEMLFREPVPCPPMPEQQAIAVALFDMDANIAALETKLAKTRQLKQGMMQELLTGRIRLV